MAKFSPVEITLYDLCKSKMLASAQDHTAADMTVFCFFHLTFPAKSIKKSVWQLGMHFLIDLTKVGNTVKTNSF